MLPKPATIEDVAHLAGVSIATVSRVVHHPEKVADSTRKKVRSAIAQSGYTTNAMARNLRRRQSNMILVLVPDIGNAFFSNILQGIEAIASRNGYGILIGNTDCNPERAENYLAYLRGHQVDGLLLLTGHLPSFTTETPAPITLPPTVAISEKVNHAHIPFVGIDNFVAARQATEHLITLGHVNIVHIAGPSGNYLTRERIAGYRHALETTGLPFDPSYILNGDFSIESGRAAVERLFIRDHLPTAFFCANDEMAIGVILALTARGYKVPDDFSVIGFDDIQFASCTLPPLTTMLQPRRLMGETAMSVMLELLDKKTPSPDLSLLHTDLIVRGSTCQRH